MFTDNEKKILSMIKDLNDTVKTYKKYAYLCMDNLTKQQVFINCIINTLETKDIITKEEFNKRFNEYIQDVDSVMNDLSIYMKDKDTDNIHMDTDIYANS